MRPAADRPAGSAERGYAGAVHDEAGELGRAFAQALAAKDHGRLREVLDPELDFRGLTPNRQWQTHGSGAFCDEVVALWLEDTDHVDELIDVLADRFADRERLTYSFRGRSDDGPFVVEQLAYFTVRDGRIDWLRILCSGFRPLDTG